MEFISSFLQQTITFFAIMDPIGISAIALSLLNTNITKTQITTVAKKSTFTILIALVKAFFGRLCGYSAKLFHKPNKRMEYSRPNYSLKFLDNTASPKPCIKISPVISAQLAVLTRLARLASRFFSGPFGFPLPRTIKNLQSLNVFVVVG